MPVFPQAFPHAVDEGMTLFEYTAIQALTGMLSGGAGKGTPSDEDVNKLVQNSMSYAKTMCLEFAKIHKAEAGSKLIKQEIATSSNLV